MHEKEMLSSYAEKDSAQFERKDRFSWQQFKYFFLLYPETA